MGRVNLAQCLHGLRDRQAIQRLAIEVAYHAAHRTDEMVVATQISVIAAPLAKEFHLSNKALGLQGREGAVDCVARDARHTFAHSLVNGLCIGMLRTGG